LLLDPSSHCKEHGEQSKSPQGTSKASGILI